MPVFISPAAMGRLAHPEGEKCLVRAAAANGIPYIVRRESRSFLCGLCAEVVPSWQVSSNSSVSLEDLAAETPEAMLFFQVREHNARLSS